MNTIIAYKENGGVSFVTSSNGYYGNILLDTNISGIRVFQNGLTVAMQISPEMECLLEILDCELGDEKVDLNEDYLKDTFIPILHEISCNLKMIEEDSETNADSLIGRILIAKGDLLYMVNYDFDFWYVPSKVCIGIEQNIINIMLNNDLALNKESIKDAIKLAFKYRKESMDKFYYLNTLDLKEEMF